MGIWIRNQDRGLGKYINFLPPVINCEGKPDPKIPFCTIPGKVLNVQVMGCDINDNEDVLGVYNSEDEAMQVLDMIQDHIAELYILPIQGHANFKYGPIFQMPPAGFSGEEEQRGPREVDLFRKVREYIRQDENYVPRKHETIGGMWTTDTWRKKGIVYQLTDEGYTSRIFSKELELDVIETMHGITWKNGDIKALEAAFLIVSKDKESDSNGNVRP